jgi:hypothetical protein
VRATACSRRARRYGAPVTTCPECGNHDVAVRLVDGVPVHECGLCGERFGPRIVERASVDAVEARARGIEPGIWPLVRVLGRLGGLAVRASAAADEVARTLPFVELRATSADALVQLENLGKSLQLAAGALRLHWVVEVEYHHHLVFVLKPRHGGGAVAAQAARDAAADVDALRKLLERDLRLSWWRHTGPGPVG